MFGKTKTAKAKAAAKPAAKKAPAPAETKSARTPNAKAAPAKARTRTAPEAEEKIGKDENHLSAAHQKAVDERLFAEDKLNSMRADVEKALEAARVKIEEDEEPEYEVLIPNLNSLHGAISNVRAVQEAVAERLRQKFQLEESVARKAQEDRKKAEAADRQ